MVSGHKISLSSPFRPPRTASCSLLSTMRTVSATAHLGCFLGFLLGTCRAARILFRRLSELRCEAMERRIMMKFDAEKEGDDEMGLGDRHALK